MKDNNVVFGVPPDGAPSEYLLSKILEFKKQGKPLIHLSRMRRLPYGFILYIEAMYT